MTTISQTVPERSRKIRSFVRREGRLSPGQQAAYAQWAPVLVLPTTRQLDFRTVFQHQAPVILEIGFGDGRSLATQARAHPHQNFIGIEVYQTGVAKLCSNLTHAGAIPNLKVMQADAVEVLANQIPANSLSGLQLFFPDPWPKARHHKRRLVQPEFLDLVASRLQPGGWVHFATDWQPYAEHMLAVLRQHPRFGDSSPNQSGFIARPAHRPLTKFELRGQKLGHGCWDLLFHCDKPCA